MNNLGGGPRAGRALVGLAIVLALSLLAMACGGDQTGDGGGDAGPTTSPDETGDSSDDGSDGAMNDGSGDEAESPSGPSTSEATTSTVPERRVVEPVSVSLPERARASASPDLAAEAITAFGFDLFSAIRRSTPTGDDAPNLTVSPASVATALAMLEPGTVDAAQGELRALLAITNADRFHTSMNSLQEELETREPGDYGDDADPGEVTIRIANAGYLQEGYPFLEEYLEVIGANYGPVLFEVDFRSDPDAVAHGINDFVADATEQQITDLIGDGVIDPATVLALVNALYFKASWLEPFDAGATVGDTFTRFDGSGVGIEMMRGTSSSSAAGDGWIGATKVYTGGLAAQFILPDDGRFDEVAANLSAVFDEYERNRSSSEDLEVPRFEVRANVELDAALQSLGLTAPYINGGLLGIAEDPKLVVDRILHQTVVAMDEEGTEASAATVILTFPTSAPPDPPVPVILDRPFLYRIIDSETGATLFLGQVVDPSQAPSAE